MATLQGYGQNVFRGAIAAPYLEKEGLTIDVLKTNWAHDSILCDKIAAAVLAWAIERGASVYCHWFQPLGASGVRHGQSAQVQNKMIEFDKDGVPQWDFNGKALLKGETDGSSYPNGGLRVTHRAGAYLCVDVTSPIFLREDTIFIPACFVAYTGEALDEKTPLLRSGDALTREGSRLLGLLGYNVKSLVTNIGLEQELFFIPRDQYLRRPDLQLTGRTIIGKMPARGQEMSDHYMAPPSTTSPVLACMRELQTECFKLGIPLRTRHREVAPNQYEFAPLFGTVTTQIDQNLMVMQMAEEIAVKHGLACLLHEKPFQGINGSGKHNNWSIATDDGTNLLNFKQLAAKVGSEEVFPVIMAAIIKAINDNGDLMRMAIASPGNDFRLGACEAPPSIISAYLGEDMTNFLDGYIKGENIPYASTAKILDMGAQSLPPFEVPAEDRNRTSPFPYGGHRFEFRAVGSSQNVSLVNTVLATIVAKAFHEFANEIESGKTPKEVAQNALQQCWKTIFNGNGYDIDNQKLLTERGNWRYDSGIDAILRYTENKNIELFQSMKVLTKDECYSRQNIMLSQYINIIEIEVLCLINMIQQYIIPSLLNNKEEDEILKNNYYNELKNSIQKLDNDLNNITNDNDIIMKAKKARILRLETMIDIRKICDKVEAIIPANLWNLATYKELLFIDLHVK